MTAVTDGPGAGRPRLPCALRPADAADVEAIRRIYNLYVATTTISFEEEPVTAEAMAGRLAGVQAAGLPWLVAATSAGVCGYACATRWRERHAYRFTVECTAYVAPEALGAGVGSALYGRLLPQLKQLGLHAVIAVIALPNPASIALHEKFGLSKVAHFREVGHKFGRWHDVGHWQALL